MKRKLYDKISISADTTAALDRIKQRLTEDQGKNISYNKVIQHLLNQNHDKEKQNALL